MYILYIVNMYILYIVHVSTDSGREFFLLTVVADGRYIQVVVSMHTFLKICGERQKLIHSTL